MSEQVVVCPKCRKGIDTGVPPVGEKVTTRCPCGQAMIVGRNQDGTVLIIPLVG